MAASNWASIHARVRLYWGLRMRTYSRTRAWSDAQFDAATERLRSRGLLDGDALTDDGRTARESVEDATDRQMKPALDALGTDIDELFAILAPWGQAVRDAKGYPESGPHDLAGATS